MKTKQVDVLPYDEAWARNFSAIEVELREALGELTVGIEHIGSTSVRGLSAKPIIDIDVVIGNDTSLEDVITALGSIGYCHKGDQGIPGREVFKYDGKKHLQKHHLYVCRQNSEELNRHIAFRNYLCSHPEAVREYSRIKEEGARLYPQDIDKYIEHKSPLILRVYEEIGV